MKRRQNERLKKNRGSQKRLAGFARRALQSKAAGGGRGGNQNGGEGRAEGC